MALAAVLSLTSNAQARSPVGGGLVLKEGRLADALRDLSVKSGSDLLFAPDVVGDLRNRRVSGPIDVEAILARLLDGTGLGYRLVGPGVYIVYRLEPEQPTALPEVLVVGKKTQNADIRRSRNDIQGYRVATSEDIQAAHSDNLDQFMRSRQTNNAESFGPSSNPRGEYATNRSEVDFRGLGPSQTLVLVDGVRMPSTLSHNYDLDLNQPDLNGLPLLAIDRIESLTGTAGGIYGPGATGGVVNIVLKRDYRGAEISATYGATDRGDAVRRRVDGRIGFTPDHGATDVMINFSRAESDGLRFGDRDFAVRSRQRRTALNGPDPGAIANGIGIRSVYDEILTLSPALGGKSLGSTYTYLPLSAAGAGDGSILLANAGKAAMELAPDGNGALRSLTSSTTVTSLLVNARHRFSPHIEGVLDFIGWENEGRSVSGFAITGFQTGLPALMQRPPGGGASDNFPFSQMVEISMPFPGMDANVTNRLRTTRASAKLIFDLPGAWRGDINYTAGASRARVSEQGWAFDQNFPLSLFMMQPGAHGEPTPEPFGSWDKFVAAMQVYKIRNTVRFERKLRLRDAAIRVAGPVARGAAGDIALSLQAERREERATITPWEESAGSTFPEGEDPSFFVATTSFFGELRAPIFPASSGHGPLRGLEAQLAARHDAIRANIPGLSTSDRGRYRYDRNATVYTAGLRAFPLDRLLVRASLATGVLPPTPQQMRPSSFIFTAGPGYGLIDSRRGNEKVGLNNDVLVLTRGSTNLRPEAATTVAIGLVLNPNGGRGPRVSLDYTRTEKRREINELGGADYFLDNETAYPSRIVRGPLSPADIAKGYSAGAITQIDATYVNASRTIVEAVDLNVDQLIRLGEDSRLRLFGSLTWTPRLTRQLAADRPVLDYVDTAEGPLRWRGSAGADWQSGDLSLRVETQYFDDYLALSPSFKRAAKPSRIPPQLYLDLSTAYRARIGGSLGARDVDIRLGIQNILGHRPPVELSDYGYSPYGDPRGRRFELSLRSQF
ncbi:TonB-dependent receptor [Caulobacter segnis]|uniref:TonB-dependent receptor n=1 Tax=Caulobacter segnis TaxID=88688 RepID=UPI0028633AF5|nr:TonB-dependent receptor [Caulobacter segnis]MDR6624407.1 outer membrane receptor protein involved in Fe transport [Caulobacter segnis]